ncbi:MAG: RDD family protein [Actinomycetota bacterium]
MADGQMQPPGWYYAQGDPPGTQRYWNGEMWQGDAQPIPGGAVSGPAAERAALAEPIKRILARIIDGVVWLVLGLVVAIPFAIFSDVGLDTTNVDSYLTQLLAGLLVVAYEVVMVATRGATIGKAALGITVTMADGSRPGFGPSARRMVLLIAYNLLRIVPLIAAVVFSLLSIVGLIMLFVDRRRQTPWDKLGDTIVKEA